MKGMKGMKQARFYCNAAAAGHILLGPRVFEVIWDAQVIVCGS